MEHLYDPQEIERRSFALIRQELAQRGLTLPQQLRPVAERVIHTTADFDYARTLYATPGAVAAAVAALRRGAGVVTDTNMALSGVSRRTLARLGGEARCYMAREEVAREARRRGITRAAVSMERAAREPGEWIFAIGNAPTALLTLTELIAQGAVHPVLVIGAPVGFVQVEESKRLLEESGAPCLIARGRKGGSTVAAATVNALLYQAVGRTL